MAERRTALLAHPGAELYGSDRMLLETVAGLVEHGWRVVLAVPNDGPLVAEAQLLGADVVFVDVPVLRKSLLRPTALAGTALSSLAGAVRIARLLRDVEPTVVYVSTLTLPLWVAVARARRIPVLCHVHESERRANRLLREALAWPLLLADRVVVNSAFSRDGLLEVAPGLTRRSTVVYNGVAGPTEVVPARHEIDGPLRIVYVGRLSPRKGPDVVVDALAQLVAAGVDARLELVGGVYSGYEWYERDLHEQVERLGLGDRVVFTGFRPSIWSALARADAGVVPSREEEPFGNTAVEAVLAGRPIVVSAIGGLAEAIDGFASALPVEPDDPAALAAALTRIANDWPGFRDDAARLAPVAAARFAPERYRREIAGAIAAVAHVPADEPVLA
ncbi:glycosyltransferase [Amnibacterium endophyticum]|uniref:Glycosyltransferase n=1 Tax=Amnibacterium endophyticum TaxID=2109337 RepID=A0ABW4LBX5_9MICO